MNLKFTPVNQSWFLIWNDQVIRIFETRSIAVNELRYCGLSVDKNGLVTV